MIAFIAHTEPADNIPSKNMEKYLSNPINSCQGEKVVNDMKNPTHVPVQSIHLISEEIKMNIGLKMNPPIFGSAFL
jgi:hypothetical protein